jgi:hypothetical protein
MKNEKCKIVKLFNIFHLNSNEQKKFIDKEFEIYHNICNSNITKRYFTKKIIIEIEAMKIGRTYNSILQVSKRWNISIIDALELCKNYEERQTY